MLERRGAIKFKGQDLTLIGEELQVGGCAPQFTVLDENLSEVTVSGADGLVRIILAVPSLDTSVCDIQTRRFNQAAASLGKEVAILTISMDLPFAQKRWCAAAGIKAVRTLSDHRDASFGTGYGVLIKELRLLARAVFVIDGEGIIRWVQIVDEVTDEPDYEGTLHAVREIL